ncbi:CYTH and CHAD domain-containing protein [Corynebacterium pseudotuberculosis]|uniref:CYTH and CHAD domain-containing protein n=1 Tax=Corynebacterium pseudotuberculosis TaxID=1719 RepID=UPI0007EBF71A|nr:CYTH and CHAD domain-containing protein [Corynebacterium pseudotuberculosis]ANK56855.1 Chad domain-containing protein [Corynebacterium pseudotuberculosis]
MGITQQLEVERKFSVADDQPVPQLVDIAYVSHVAETTVHSLSALYFDTPDLRLSRAKIALRRRTGGKDAGWHLKISTPEGRVETHVPLGDDSVEAPCIPEDLLAFVRSITRSQPLAPIARIDNERHESLLTDDKGEYLAEFCDDHVHAWSYLPGGSESRWREWEIEITAYAQDQGLGTELIDSAETVLVEQGAHTARSSSKIAQALGDSVNNVPSPPQMAELDPKSPEYALVAALKRNRDRLVALDPLVRQDAPDSIHQMRVATRELRSHMKTFDGLLGGKEYKQMEKDLKIFGRILGSARDAEVIAARFEKLLSLNSDRLVDSTTSEFLLKDIQRDYLLAHRRVVSTLNHQRYLDFLDSLDSLLAEPPVLREDTTFGQETPDESHSEAILFHHLEKTMQRLYAQDRKARQEQHDPAISLERREANFHNVRKAAKKLRYSAEAVGDSTSLNTDKLYAACKHLQTVLGDFQDAVTSRDRLYEKALRAERKGNPTFGYGVLHQQEHQNALSALDDYSEAFYKVTKAYRKFSKNVEKFHKKAQKKAAKKSRKRT